MSNVIGLSQYHEDNLRKLAAYLLSGKLKAKFDMEWFSDKETPTDAGETETTCGTVGCAAGHGTLAGISKKKGETWGSYIERQYGLTGGNFYYSWCFQGDWSWRDNTPEGAAKRILWLLDKGLPDNASEQCRRLAPLCYL